VLAVGRDAVISDILQATGVDLHNVTTEPNLSEALRYLESLRTQKGAK
jgi:hypothetical protein